MTSLVRGISPLLVGATFMASADVVRRVFQRIGRHNELGDGKPDIAFLDEILGVLLLSTASSGVIVLLLLP
jgi:hypothetical protein